MVLSTEPNRIKTISSLQKQNLNLIVALSHFRVLRFPPPVKTDRHDITEILLKVALGTTNLTLTLIALQH
jgi:hypothetical protein